MTELVDAIRAAIEAEASPEARAAGAAACRSLIATLEPPAPPLVSPEAMAQLATMLRGMNLDQVFDLAIAKLRTLEAARPSAALAAHARPFTIQMVPLPGTKK